MQSSFALVQHIAALFPLGKRNTHAPNLNKLHFLAVSSSALEVKRNSPPLSPPRFKQNFGSLLYF